MFSRSILAIALCAFLGACADGTRCLIGAAGDSRTCAGTAGALQYTNVPGHSDAARAVSLRVDRDFNTYERAKILRAVNEWNHVLNGYMRLDLSTEAYDPAHPAARTADTWSVVKTDGSHGWMKSAQMKRTLAITMGGSRAQTIFVVADRIGSRDLGGIFMHEFGHALEAAHDSDSRLMNPYCIGDLQGCIDKATVKMLASRQKLPLANPNWCDGQADREQLAEAVSSLCPVSFVAVR